MLKTSASIYKKNVSLDLKIWQEKNGQSVSTGQKSQKQKKMLYMLLLCDQEAEWNKLEEIYLQYKLHKKNLRSILGAFGL